MVLSPPVVVHLAFLGMPNLSEPFSETSETKRWRDSAAIARLAIGIARWSRRPGGGSEEGGWRDTRCHTRACTSARLSFSGEDASAALFRSNTEHASRKF